MNKHLADQNIWVDETIIGGLTSPWKLSLVTWQALAIKINERFLPSNSWQLTTEQAKKKPKKTKIKRWQDVKNFLKPSCDLTAPDFLGHVRIRISGGVYARLCVCVCVGLCVL